MPYGMTCHPGEVTFLSLPQQSDFVTPVGCEAELSYFTDYILLCVGQKKLHIFNTPYLWNLFCSLAFLDPRVGHTMDVLSPFIPVLCHYD